MPVPLAGAWNRAGKEEITAFPPESNTRRNPGQENLPSRGKGRREKESQVELSVFQFLNQGEVSEETILAGFPVQGKGFVHSGESRPKFQKRRFCQDGQAGFGISLPEGG